MAVVVLAGEVPGDVVDAADVGSTGAEVDTTVADAAGACSCFQSNVPVMPIPRAHTATIPSKNGLRS